MKTSFLKVGPIACAAVLPLLVLALTSIATRIEIAQFTRDLAALAKLPAYSGALSNLGILLWWSSATVWCLSALLFHGAGQAPSARFAASAAGLSSYLALDDLFQLHEVLFPDYVGLPEKGVYALLGLAVLAWLWRGWPMLRERGLLLFGALCMLAASVAVDSLLGRFLWRLGQWNFLLEDGCKWLGIVLWCAFAFDWCLFGLRACLHSAPASPAAAAAYRA